ncbi:MAG TPA: hypothetical protein VMF55_01010 [Solirubrobacterales bacterium]|nr:hypothetical protein [Solirubrobacterales bacterium]
MGYFLIGVTVFIEVIALSTVLRPGADDPNWELRWRSLDPVHRDWLASMTTDPRWMRTLSDPEEVALARGFSRRQSRSLAHFELAAGVVAALAVVLTLAGLAPASTVGIGLGLVALVRVSVESWRTRQIRRKVRLGFEPGELPTPLTQTPS